MDRKRILIIENSTHVTGALNAVLRSSKALKEKYDFIFAIPQGSKAFGIVKEEGFQVFEVPMLEISKRFLSVLLYIPTLTRSVYHVKKIIRQERISLVHVNDFYNLIMPLWRLFGGSVRYVCHVNFIPNRFPVLLRKLWIQNHMLFSNKIIAVSKVVFHQLPASSKVVCINNPLPELDGSSDEIPERGNILLFMGNFMEGKGQDLAIRAFALISKIHLDWKLRMVGSDMGMDKNTVYKSGLISLTKKLNIERQVEWGSFSEDVRCEYEKASVALNFSKSESFSLTVQEAMFYGCPVIATCSGGPEELIEHNYSGLLIPVDDVTAMSKAIRYLIENPKERSRMMLNAQRTIQEKCSKSNTIDQLDLVYQDILSR